MPLIHEYTQLTSLTQLRLPLSLPSRPAITHRQSHKAHQTSALLGSPFSADSLRRRTTFTTQVKPSIRRVLLQPPCSTSEPTPEPNISEEEKQIVDPATTQETISPEAASSPLEDKTLTTPTIDAKSGDIGPNRSNIAALVISIALVVVTGIGNRLLYKMALKPLGNYVFFLAQLQTFGYCFVYFAALTLRYKAGFVSNAMLKVPKMMIGTFIAIGFVEAMSSLLSFIGAANLPGVVLPLLSQTVLFWQVLLATTVLGKRLGTMQIGGVALVVIGVALAAWPGSSGAGGAFANSILSGVNPMYAIIFVIAMLFPALDTIFKERVFRTWREKWSDGKKDLDLFVVNSWGSAAQAVFVFLLLPIITAARGMALGDLPGYLSAGWDCCRGLTPPCGGDCSGAPLIPLLYVAFNLFFNVSALMVIRTAGNLAISIVMSAIVPATLFAFTLPLPYLDPAPPLGPNFLLGAGLLMVGLGAYNAPMWAPALKRYLDALKEKSRTEWGPAAEEGGDNGQGGKTTGVVAS